MIVFGVIYLLRVNNSVQASWWDASWLYRKSIGITNSSGTPLVNYQVQIFNNLDLSSEISLGKIQDNLNDLRFTDINGNLLSYWIEDTTSTSVDVWLRIASIPESGISVYMYYGNSIASPGKSIIGTSSFPALSCKSILASGSSTGSGAYFVDFTNGYLADEQEVYCDMTDNDGGWMLVEPEMISSVISRYVEVHTETDSNGGVFYIFTHQDVGCDNNDTGATVQVTSTIQWDKVRAKHSLVNGKSYCWSMDGTGNYGGQRTNSNLETFLVGTDVVQNCVLSCEDPQFVIPPLTRCDDTAENYGIYNVVSERSFELISRRKNRTSVSGPALGLSCNDMNMTSKIENIYIKEDYLSYDDVSVGAFSGQELALGIAGVSAKLGSRIETLTPPILYYNFDEGYGTTTYNYGTTTNSGTIYGASWTSDGKFGKALSFYERADNYVSIPNVISGDNTHTISFWVKPTSDGVMFDMGGNEQDAYSFIKLTRSGLDVSYVPNNIINYDWRTYPYDFTLGRWYHIVIAKTGVGDNLNVYIDGKLLTIYIGTVGNMNVGSIMYLGKFHDDGLGIYGLLDEVRVYDYALSESQVKVDYNQGMTMVMGSTGTNTSASSDYCIPGDTSFCAPPVAEYKFEKKSGTLAYDTSGNNKNGEIFGANSVMGKFGSAMSFDGNDYINCGTIATSGEITVSMWFKNSDAESQKIIFDINGTNSRGHFAFNWLNNRPILYLANNNFRYFNSSAQNYLDGRWHHLVVYIAGTKPPDILNSKLYIDNNNIPADATISTEDPVARSNFFIRYNNSSGFNGDIDDVRIYNYARTPAQIAWDYNKGAPIAHYKFDECSDVVLHDESGNGLDGTITIGTDGSQSAAGTCTDNNTASAWYNGRNGKRKASLNFDGSDDYVDITTNGYTSNISVSFWFNTTSNNSEMVIFANGAGGTDVLDSIGLDKGLIFYSQNNYAKITINKFNDGLWHYAVLDVANKKIYVDGVDQFLVDSDIYKVSDEMLIGASYKGRIHGDFFSGKIDDLKIFNYAFTPEQVKLDYAGSAIKFN